MNATAKKTTDPLKIKWRGHPTEMQANGRAEALRYPVAVHNLRHGEFGIYYGGKLIEKVLAAHALNEKGEIITFPSTNLKGEAVQRKSRDYGQGYAAAKARAQALVETWLASDKAWDAKQAAEEKAAADARFAAEKAAEDRETKTARAVEIAKAFQCFRRPEDNERLAPEAFELADLVVALLGGK